MNINNLKSSNDELIELNKLYFLPQNMIENRNQIRGFVGNTTIKKCKKLFVEAPGKMQGEVLNQNLYIPLYFEYV